MTPRRMHLLAIAFACEPGQGSEPGIGWNFVEAAATRGDTRLTVLTHTRHRDGLDAALARREWPHVEPVYLELGGWRERMWDRHATLNVYYYLWNLLAGREAVRRHALRPFDLVHHVSYVRYWMPSAGMAVASRDVPFVFGPVGGAEEPPKAFRVDLGAGERRTERVRTLTRQAFERDPRLETCVRRAAACLAATPESAARLRKLGARRVEVVPCVTTPGGAAMTPPRRASRPSPTPLHLVSAGRLLAWKGFQYGLRAFAAAGLPGGSTYTVLGDGPYREGLGRLAGVLGVADRVAFAGAVSQSTCVEAVASADVMMHPSLRDSGGLACAEALSAGVPVVCLDLGGPAAIVNDACGLRASVASPDEAVQAMAERLRTWSRDPASLDAARSAAVARADELSAATRADRFMALYRSLIDEATRERIARFPTSDAVCGTVTPPEAA